MKPKLTWVHLSDWHQDIIRRALMEDIRQFKSINPALKVIDFIVFSGDLTNTGKTEEFLAAKRELIEPVMEAAGLKDRYDRLFLIPGNHDVDRDIVSLLNQDLYNKPQQVIDEYFIHEK